MKYRADVDGLRAIAVLSVVIFHFTRDGLAGGYLGVDIFFVLSGFLITGIIHREIVDASFTMAGFYERRIRRIAPALLVMLAVATAVASLILLPADLEGYGKALLSTLGFVANIYSWRDTDYFARASEDKPLLHMWSLGVEEQFYILFPLILAFVVRRRQQLALPLVALMTLASFILNCLALKVGGANPAFYLFPTRAWELGCGALVALAVPFAGSSRLAATARSVASGVFLVAIVYGLINPIPPLPILPDPTLVVLSTAALLQLGKSTATPPTKVLALRPLVWVGLISYSLYLWHWPVIVFSRYFLVRELTGFEMIIAFVVMTVAACASFRYIERPFRDRNYPVRKLYVLTATGALLLALAGSAFIWFHGLPQRLNREAAVINAAVGTNYRCPVSQLLAFGASRACTLHLASRDPADAELVLLGNSHAQMYAPIVEEILKKRDLPGLLLPLNGCLPTVSANLNQSCLSLARANFDALDGLERVHTVILASNWWLDVPALVDPSGKALDNARSRAMVDAFDDLVTRFEAQGKHVILVGPIAEPGWDVASEVSRKRAFGWPEARPLGLPSQEFFDRFGDVIDHFETRSDMTFLRPDRVQCDAISCRFIVDGRSLFADSNHLAAPELWRFRDMFDAAIR